MIKELLMLKGLPASGKSSFAKTLGDGWKRVNKDDLRAMIDGGKWSKKNEKLIIATEYGLVETYLSQGYNVVVDDTNFHPDHQNKYSEIAKKYGAILTVKFFDTPLMECIRRDALRGDKSVGAKVIFGFYDRYLKPKPVNWGNDKQNCFVFDIDGTLAKMNGRSPYDMSKVLTDSPNHNITMIARTLAASGLPIVVMSGREDCAMNDTLKWMLQHHVPCDHLIMRKTGDNRKDSIVKKELYEKHVKDKYNVIAVFDDRDQVVEMWRSLGLTCLQVDYGMF